MDKKLKFNADDVKDIVKCVLISIVSCLALILLFAIVVKFANLSDSVIKPVNIIIKSVSVIAGILFGIKHTSVGAIKGLLTSILFVLVTYILFAIINQDWSFDISMLIDAIILIVEGLAGGVLTVNIKDRSGRR